MIEGISIVVLILIGAGFVFSEIKDLRKPKILDGLHPYFPEKQDLIRALKADDCYYFISEIKQYLRNLEKYEGERLDKINGSELIEEIRDSFNDKLMGSGIDLDSEYS